MLPIAEFISFLCVFNCWVILKALGIDIDWLGSFPICGPKESLVYSGQFDLRVLLVPGFLIDLYASYDNVLVDIFYVGNC